MWFKATVPTLNPRDTWIPVVVANGVATLGSLVYHASADLPIGDKDNLWADTLTNTLTWADVTAYSPANNLRAMLEVALANADLIQVQTDLLSGATEADVFLQLGE